MSEEAQNRFMPPMICVTTQEKAPVKPGQSSIEEAPEGSALNVPESGERVKREGSCPGRFSNRHCQACRGFDWMRAGPHGSLRGCRMGTARWRLRLDGSKWCARSAEAAAVLGAISSAPCVPAGRIWFPCDRSAAPGLTVDEGHAAIRSSNGAPVRHIA